MKSHAIIQVADPALERMPIGAMHQIGVACDVWLKRRGLAYEDGMRGIIRSTCKNNSRRKQRKEAADE